MEETWGITPTSDQLDDVLNQAQKLMANQQTGSAEEATRFVLHYRPDDARAKFILATALLINRRLDEAEELFTEALDNSEYRYSAIFNLGNVHADREDHDKAIDYYRQALDLKPGSQMIRFVIAREQSAKGDTSAAQEAFAGIAAEQPDDPFDFPQQAKDELEKLKAKA